MILGHVIRLEPTVKQSIAFARALGADFPLRGVRVRRGPRRKRREESGSVPTACGKRNACGEAGAGPQTIADETGLVEAGTSPCSLVSTKKRADQ